MINPILQKILNKGKRTDLPAFRIGDTKFTLTKAGTAQIKNVVSNPATGRQLTITYNGNLVSSVTDGKRTVSYGYTSGNLTSFTDALSQELSNQLKAEVEVSIT